MFSVVIEQTKAYKYRVVYDPVLDTFNESEQLSLLYARDFPYPYGWLKESGTPPGKHLDVILIADETYALGDTVEVKIIGVFKRADGDHKLVGVLIDNVVEDLCALDVPVLSELNGLYVKLNEGEGWYGKDEANQVIDDYFERRFM